MLRKKLKLGKVTDGNVTTSETVEQLNIVKSPASLVKLAELGSGSNSEMPFWKTFYDIECNLNEQLRSIDFVKGVVAAVYNPIEYAADLHCAYLARFLTGTKDVLFIGMNPGPWGMVQTGIPFGYIPAVRDWLKLSGTVNRPEKEIPSRPVTGLNCDKAEQSGQRFWGLLQELCGDNPDTFFDKCFVHNLCPLAFFQSSGKNVTPAELKPINVRKDLNRICLAALTKQIELISPKIIISVGHYAEQCVNGLFKEKLLSGSIDHKCIPHPSPRSLNNTNWNEKATKWLAENNVMHYIKKD